MARKWLPYDLWAVRESRYTIHPANWPANQYQTAGLANTKNKRGPSNKEPWAGRIYCLCHGFEKDDFDLTHKMTKRGGQKDWACFVDWRKDKQSGKCTVEFCTSVAAGGKSDLPLDRVLNQHLIRNLRRWLYDHGEELFGGALDQAQVCRARLEALKTQVAQLQRDLAKANIRMEVFQNNLESMEPSFATRQLDDFYKSTVRPKMLAIHDVERQIAVVERELVSVGGAADSTEAALRSKLQRIIDLGEAMLNEQLVALLDLFVKRVGVIASRDAREYLIEFVWKSGRRDVLVAWKGWIKDVRPWSDEERSALAAAWPASSGLDYKGIKSKLLPGRRWNSIYRQCLKDHLTDGSRGRQWQFAAEASDRSVPERHPELAYLKLEIGSMAELVAAGGLDCVAWAFKREGIHYNFIDNQEWEQIKLRLHDVAIRAAGICASA